METRRPSCRVGYLLLALFLNWCDIGSITMAMAVVGASSSSSNSRVHSSGALFHSRLAVVASPQVQDGSQDAVVFMLYQPLSSSRVMVFVVHVGQTSFSLQDRVEVDMLINFRHRIVQDRQGTLCILPVKGLERRM
jgi:hypothetical protein